MASLTGEEGAGLRERLRALVAEPLGEPATLLREARLILGEEHPTGDDIAWAYDNASTAAPRRPREALVWARIAQEACRTRIARLGRLTGRRELKDLRRWLASARVFEGRLLVGMDSPVAALTVLEEVLAGGEEYLVDPAMRTRAEFLLVRARSALGDPLAADRLGSALAASLAAERNYSLAAETLAVVAGAHHRVHEEVRAAELLADAAGYAVRSGDRRQVGRVALATAQVAAARGDHALAASQVDLARSSAAGSGDPSQLGQVEETAARLLLAEGRLDDAARVAERAAAQLELAGEETMSLRAQLLRAQILRLGGDLGASRTLLLSIAPAVAASSSPDLVAALEAERALS